MADTRDEPPKLELSLAQVLASTLATLTGAVLSSFAGVGGTLIGAGLMSVICTVGTALYLHSMQRTRDRLRRARAGTAEAVSIQPVRERSVDWPRVTAIAVGVFAVVLAGVTVFELAVRQPLSSWLRGRDDGGTSVGRVVDPGPRSSDGRTPGPVPATPPAEATAVPDPSLTPTAPEPTPAPPGGRSGTPGATPLPTDSSPPEPSGTATP